MGFLRRLLGGALATAAPDPLADAWLMEPHRPDAVLEVVGESFYQKHLLRVGGDTTPNGVRLPDHIAVLVPEPTNKYDENAIAVGIDGNTVGHLSRADAIAFQPLVRWAKARGHRIAGKARLTGGWDRGGGDRGSVGVILNIGTAAETLAELILKEQSPHKDHRWVGRTVVFTGASQFAVGGARLDDTAMTVLARAAGMYVGPRVTKSIQLLVECESVGSANSMKAVQYGIEIVPEAEFWSQIGLDVTPIAWHANR